MFASDPTIFLLYSELQQTHCDIGGCFIIVIARLIMHWK